MKKYHKASFCGIVLCTVVSMCGCSERDTPVTVLRPVRVEKAVSLERAEKSYSGIVAADQFSDLAFKNQGLLVEMNVEEGQHVKTGSIVAEMDPADFLLAVDDKKAAYQKASSEKERTSRLFAKNAVSRQEFESALMTYTNARIALENAQNALANTKLRAPFDGFIQKKYVENYQRVQPGEPIVCLVNPKLLQIVTTIPETSVDFIASPSNIEVEFDAYKGTRFRAHVKKYVEASPDGAGIPAYIVIDDPKFDLSVFRISVGFSCKVHISKPDPAMAGKLGIPLSAIVFDNATGKMSVFVYDSTTHKVHRRSIAKQGDIAGRNLVVIDDNLGKDILIVTAGASLLNDGDSVVVLKNGKMRD